MALEKTMERESEDTLTQEQLQALEELPKQIPPLELMRRRATGSYQGLIEWLEAERPGEIQGHTPKRKSVSLEVCQHKLERLKFVPTRHKEPHPRYDETTTLGKTRFGRPVTLEQFENNNFYYNGLDEEDLSGQMWWKAVWDAKDARMRELHCLSLQGTPISISESEKAELDHWRRMNRVTKGVRRKESASTNSLSEYQRYLENNNPPSHYSDEDWPVDLLSNASTVSLRQAEEMAILSLPVTQRTEVIIHPAIKSFEYLDLHSPAVVEPASPRCGSSFDRRLPSLSSDSTITPSLAIFSVERSLSSSTVKPSGSVRDRARDVITKTIVRHISEREADKSQHPQIKRELTGDPLAENATLPEVLGDHGKKSSSLTHRAGQSPYSKVSTKGKEPEEQEIRADKVMFNGEEVDACYVISGWGGEVLESDGEDYFDDSDDLDGGN